MEHNSTKRCNQQCFIRNAHNITINAKQSSVWTVFNKQYM